MEDADHASLVSDLDALLGEFSMPKIVAALGVPA
jgi:hypothetical protein